MYLIGKKLGNCLQYTKHGHRNIPVITLWSALSFLAPLSVATLLHLTLVLASSPMTVGLLQTLSLSLCVYVCVCVCVCVCV